MKSKKSDESFLRKYDVDLAPLITLLQAARTELCNQDLQLPMLLVFLEIAREPGISLSQLEQRVGLSQAAVSRIVAKLGRGMLSQNGLHLVHAYENPAGRRSKLVELTSTGASALARILCPLNA